MGGAWNSHSLIFSLYPFLSTTMQLLAFTTPTDIFNENLKKEKLLSLEKAHNIQEQSFPQFTACFSSD